MEEELQGERRRLRRNWGEAMAHADQMDLPPFEGFLAGHACRCSNNGTNEKTYTELLLSYSHNKTVLNWILAAEGISYQAQPVKAQARLGVAVANLKTAGLWPW